ncbi:DNA-binding transcriptional LysR family regulator [Ochrobactrum daejeonense]|uniref:DNA-binding transcriptional LysR family regulator n=1 Tax=Brucella daejeonensis TaxID=659015 RepID=A0A7W9ENI3_9HYPH|nr:LysR family transcriptional regulator [Brucella daejeonensis]MBB5704593.1 DNA-binding transcriptional LysR family regulator [Brucella daejeonensis]
MAEKSDLIARAGIRSAAIFREIVRMGSTRRAARELGITQSAVSQQLKTFEENVGEQLFERDRRGLVPTSRALEIYNRVDRYLEILGQIETELADSFRTKRNTLSITAPHVLTLDLLPRIVAVLNEQDPSYEFHLKAQRYDQMVQSILTGEADIGISRLPLDERFFEWEVVSKSNSVCVMRPDHPLAHKDVITVDDIADEPIVALEREYASRKGGVLTFGRREVSLNCKIYTDAIGLDASFVAHGIGIAIDNSFIARHYRMFDLKIVPFEPALTYEYVVFWRRESERFFSNSTIVRTFADVIKQEQIARHLSN